jgi:glycine hydroxymethyltransferase
VNLGKTPSHCISIKFAKPNAIFAISEVSDYVESKFSEPEEAMNVTTRPNTMQFFEDGLEGRDPEIAALIRKEWQRQSEQVELIASENITSRAVREAQGSVLTNKYAEGYPGRRYYGGCEFVDGVEEIAIERAKALYGCGFANVQPNSGSQANQAVFLALLQPGETILGMSLDAGGHLTHGAAPNMSGKWFRAISYGVRQCDHRIDYDGLREIALREQPKLIIAGGSAYPRTIDFAAFRAIADEIGAHLLVDMAHFSGLVAGGVYPSPFPHAHIVTTTTHKTLRGPRGGLILTNDEGLAKKINSAIFPGLQGGPLMHVIAGKAVAFGEALQPEFKEYARRVVENSKAFAARLEAGGLALVSGGTDSHLALLDLRPKALKGNKAEAALERAHITCNKNGVPFDPEKPTVTSGLRVGTPAGTTRGFAITEFELVADAMVRVLDALRDTPDGDAKVEAETRDEIIALCKRFPIYRD